MTVGNTGALTRRRLGGAVLLLAGIVIAAIVLWPGGGRAEPEPLPVRIVSVPPLGLGFAHPREWKRNVDGQVLRLTSPDGTLVLLFSSPFDRPNRGFVKAEAKSALLKRFAPAKVVREGPARLGTQKVTSFEITGERDDEIVRALVHVGSSRWRTYLVTMLTGENPSKRRLEEARKILDTVSFSKPRKI
ncbi:MAG TPA: hypothetical protein VGR11_10620 [Solirubrobacteraceae bacterium]|nr:hypothetical protein [Solirubrobacteraceae bacterium]